MFYGVKSLVHNDSTRQGKNDLYFPVNSTWLKNLYILQKRAFFGNLLIIHLSKRIRLGLVDTTLRVGSWSCHISIAIPIVNANILFERRCRLACLGNLWLACNYYRVLTHGFWCPWGELTPTYNNPHTIWCFNIFIDSNSDIVFISYRIRLLSFQCVYLVFDGLKL